MSASKSDDKDSSKEEEEVKNVWDSAMFHAAETIVKSTSRKDLGSLTLTNKDWYDVASREVTKRYFIQHLPLNYDVDEQLAIPTASSELKVKPQVSLLIYDEKLVMLYRKWLRQNAANNPEPDLCLRLLDHFKRDVPNNSLAMKVTEVLTSNSMEFNRGLIGIFFPSMEQRNRTQIASIPYKPSLKMVFDPGDWIVRSTRRLVQDLDLDNPNDPKCCILILLQPYDPFAAEAVYILKRTVPRIQEGIDDMWIGELARWPTRACNHPTHEQNRPNILVALKITGPDIVSCTATIDLSQSPDVVRNILIELRKKITLKRYRTGLISGPSKNEHDCAFKDSNLIMNAVKEVFPEVPFVGLFGNHRHSPLCFTTSPEELKKSGIDTQRRVEHRSMSIIIITYD